MNGIASTARPDRVSDHLFPYRESVSRPPTRSPGCLGDHELYEWVDCPDPWP